MSFPMRYCHACGCTEDTACAGGCYWVSLTRCSACRDRKLQHALTPTEAEALREMYLRSSNPMLGAITRKVCADHIHCGRLTIRRYRGNFLMRMTDKGRKFLASHTTPVPRKRAFARSRA